MGIAKTINAIGKYDFYTFDYIEFANKISSVFNVNLELFFIYYIDEFDEVSEKENELVDAGYIDTWRLSINYFKINDNLHYENNLTCQYDLYIPVDIKYENELMLEFCDNGFFVLNYLPYNISWNFFIEDILGFNDCYFNTKLDFFDNITTVRNAYISIIQKINCSEVILTTDAGYKFENYFNPVSENLTLNELIQKMKQEDNINIYNFCEVVNTRLKLESKRNSFLDVALIDNFNDIVDLSKIELNKS